MNLQNKIFVMIIFTTLLLTGCAATKHHHTSQIYHSLSGNVADGYIQGARVCLDINQNKICDSDEPHTVTVQNGKFYFTHLTDKQINSPLIAQVTKSSIDAESKKHIKIPYIMLAPRKSTFISPLTTLVEYKIQLGNSLIPAMVDISKKTGVSLLYVDGNFIKSDSLAAKKAEFVAKIIVKTTQLVEQALKSRHLVPDTLVSINTTRYLSEQILNHAIIIKNFVASVCKNKLQAAQIDMHNTIQKLSKDIIKNLDNYNKQLKIINKKIQKAKRKTQLSKEHTNANKTVHTKSDAENIGAIIFVLTLQLFFFVFLAFYL